MHRPTLVGMFAVLATIALGSTQVFACDCWGRGYGYNSGSGSFSFQGPPWFYPPPPRAYGYYGRARAYGYGPRYYFTGPVDYNERDFIFRPYGSWVRR